MAAYYDVAMYYDDKQFLKRTKWVSAVLYKLNESLLQQRNFADTSVDGGLS